MNSWRLNEFIDLYVETNIPLFSDGEGSVSVGIFQETPTGWIPVE